MPATSGLSSPSAVRVMIVPNAPQSTAAVADHYDELDLIYRRVWGEHVHHGLWTTGRESPTQAVEALVDTVGDRLRLEVDNDGSSIPADALPHIFEPFFTRGDGKGTGLGLAIVRRIVKEHGGEIRVDSGEGGTRFTIELPLPAPAS